MTKEEIVAYIKSKEEREYKTLEQYERDYGIDSDCTAARRAAWAATYDILMSIT